MPYEVITGPSEEIVTAAECKLVARFTATGLDSLITSDFIPAARRILEHRLQRSLVTQTLTKTIDRWPTTSDIELRYGPVQSISSITYVDDDDVVQTVSPGVYSLDKKDKVGSAWVLLQEGQSWPLAKDVANAIVVTFVAGYGAASAVPKELRNWLMVAVAEMIKTGVPEVQRDLAAGLLDPVVDARY